MFYIEKIIRILTEIVDEIDPIHFLVQPKFGDKV